MLPSEFIPKAMAAAIASEHIWPDYAVCEAALESGWGESKLAKLCNDLFGQKCGPSTINKYPVVEIPTHEWVDNTMVEVMAKWPQYPDWRTAFIERMNLLRFSRMYVPALNASTGERFIQLVSPVWASDPGRADKVLAIHRHHFKDSHVLGASGIGNVMAE